MIRELAWVLRKNKDNVFDELSKTNQKHNQYNLLYNFFLSLP